MKFSEIEFGMAAAEKERSNKPHLLIDGFLDAYGYVDKVLKGDKFLILGPKGSGKSAIGSKLELESQNENRLYVQTYYLEDFPYNTFSGILPGREAPETKFPSHWEFLLLISFMDSFSNDTTCKSTGRADINKIIEVLQELGMISGKSLTDIVKNTTKKEFKVSLPKVLEGSYSSEKETKKLDITLLFNSLQEVCYSLKTESRHIIVIDGLDDVLTRREKQYTSLSALILAADRINTKFSRNNIGAKIIILCRTDLFEKLPGPNKNKIRQDSAVILDWYQDARNISSTNLVKLINLRAKLSLGRDVNIFEDILPLEISPGLPTAKALLDHTRHTPRDIIQLLNKIQEHTKGTIPTPNEIKNGIRTYSFDYLVPEIKDELTGYLESDEIEQVVKLLGSMEKSLFNLDDLQSMVENDERFSLLDSMKLLNALFDCNAIGTVKGNVKKYYSWKYRNRYASFSPNEDIVVHRGLRKGLNLP
jgi:hypothetical protein